MKRPPQASKYCMQLEIPDEAYYHPITKQMRDATNDILAWANVSQPSLRKHFQNNTLNLRTQDIYSFNKEQACGVCLPFPLPPPARHNRNTHTLLSPQDHQNLVAIVALERDIPVQSAISYVTLIVQAAIDRYLDARARFPSFGPETDEVVKK